MKFSVDGRKVITTREARAVAEAVAVAEAAAEVDRLRAELARIMSTVDRRLSRMVGRTKADVVSGRIGIAVPSESLLCKREGAALTERAGRFWVVRNPDALHRLPAWSVGYAGLLTAKGLMSISLFRSNRQRSAVVVAAELRSVVMRRQKVASRHFSRIPKGATVDQVLSLFPSWNELIMEEVFG